jgi:Phospholipase_D-nuclease N-terminal
MIGGVGLVAVGLLLFWVWAIYDVVTTDPSRVRNLPKVMWLVIVIVLAPFALDLGAILWMVAGRQPRAPRAASHPQQAQRRPRRAQEPAPEADLHTQRVVTDRRSAELDRMLEEWERTKRDEAAPES